MKCEFCRFQPPVGAEGYQDECVYFEKYGKIWKDGREGCTLTHAQLAKWDDEYSTYLGDMGLDMGMADDFEHLGLSMERAINVCKHMLGMDVRKTYKRHGKVFYKPYRNYFYGFQKELDYMTGLGLIVKQQDVDDKHPYYWLTKEGTRWLERKTGIVIRELEE